MPRVTICVDADTPEQAMVQDWLAKWSSRLAYVSKNEGCGCCIDLYNVDAPEEALRELPVDLFSFSEWSRS